MREIVIGKKTEKEKKKKYEERVARMERVANDDDDDDDDDEDDSDDGYDEERELRRIMRVSRETYEAEQARMAVRWGGAGSSRAHSNPHENIVRRGSLDPFLHRTQSIKQPKISSSIMGDMKIGALKMGRAISKVLPL
eukprot:TRINITY_DN18497_c0_g1_i2.p1 TRINITY_DN18497_c0_g1~~TRINITY_DN18497_c0_g1_i2.p1  ORF type:complete len:138 (-),score=42.08 TRINITY_DN18497_c0_g1_i2:370-783(-)